MRFIAISWPDGNPTAYPPWNETAKNVPSYNYKETLLFFCAAQHIFAATGTKNIVTDV